MSEIQVVYFSSTGHTETMAGMVAKGIEKAGKKAALVEISQADADSLKEAERFALGCPACGAEELDESMESLMDEIAGSLDGKEVGLFGSYGWGGGDWMREWETRISGHGGKVAGGEGVITLEEPDKEAEEALMAMGEALAG